MKKILRCKLLIIIEKKIYVGVKVYVIKGKLFVIKRYHGVRVLCKKKIKSVIRSVFDGVKEMWV